VKLRRLAVDASVIAMTSVWAYALIAVVVAQLGDGQSTSFLAVFAAVLLAHLLARGLAHLDVEQTAMRAIGLSASAVLLYAILRVEIAGDIYLWDLAWLADLITDMGGTVEGHSGDVALFLLLSAVWGYCVARASRPITFERVGGEVGIGLALVLISALFAEEAGAPDAVRWLPAPYLAIALTALAVVHMSDVSMDRARPFAQAWALWVGGSLLAIAAVAIPTTLIDYEVLAFIGDGFALIGKGIGIALVFIFLTPLVGLVWVVEQLFSFLPFEIEGDPITPEEPDNLEEFTEEKDETADWQRVFGWVMRIGVVGAAVAFAVMLLWFAFRRLSSDDEDEVDAREGVAIEEGGGVAALFGNALGRLRGRFGRGAAGRDAIGRLYMKMLARAEAQGLARPPSATPLEFAPQLNAHFVSQVPGEVSATYSEARYGGRRLPKENVDALDRRWSELLDVRKHGDTS